MTYCIGLYLDDGLVMLSDTRTNAGVDNISTYRKMTVWETPGERVIALLTAGNLAVSQAVVNLLNEGIEIGEPAGTCAGGDHTILTVPSMFQAARLVGRAVREVWRNDAEPMRAQDTAFAVSMILGGQIRGRTMRLFQIYAAGNFIEATVDTPYFQIGEIKYGKPILDRAAHYETDLVSGVKLCLISMDSTLRSNLTVGLPMDLLVYRKDALEVGAARRIEAEDPYFKDLSQRWSEALRDAYGAIPSPPWLTGTGASEP